MAVKNRLETLEKKLGKTSLHPCITLNIASGKGESTEIRFVHVGSTVYERQPNETVDDLKNRAIKSGSRKRPPEI